jgi:hypothetical protein
MLRKTHPTKTKYKDLFPSKIIPDRKKKKVESLKKGFNI